MPWSVEIDPFSLVDLDDPTKSKIPHNLPFGVGAASAVPVARSPILQAAGKKKASGTFEPAPPASAIDFYAPNWAISTQSVFQKYTPGGTIASIEVLAGCPDGESWQKVLSSVCRVDSGAGTEIVPQRPIDTTTNRPVYFWQKQNLPAVDMSLIRQTVLELRNSRVDASLLRAVTWNQLDALSGINVFQFYRSPEAVVESNHAKIKAFVETTLGANHRQHFTPFDAARKLFQAVLAHVHYYYFSETGAYAYYFGNIPDLNARHECMRGNTFTIGDITTSWLQIPYGPVAQGTVTVASTESHAALVQVSQSEAQSLGQAHAPAGAHMHAAPERAQFPQGIQVPAAFKSSALRARVDVVTACPCHTHGGFAPRPVVGTHIVRQGGTPIGPA
jgi:hypothetical protein